MADERNGNWEWLAHFVPDDVHHIIGDFQPGVRKISDEGFYTVEIILDEYEGKLIVGSYESIEFMTDREINDELLDYINRVICNEIGTSMVSALAMTVRSAIGDTDDVSSDDDSTDDTTADYAAEYMRSYVDEDEDDDDHRTFQPLHKKRHVEDEE